MFKKTAKPARRPSDIVLRQLEDRILFDAVPGIAFDGPHENLLDHGPIVEQPIDHVADAQQPARKEIVFVDTSVDGYQQLVDGLLSSVDAGKNLELVLLDASRGGIQQITEALTPYRHLDAIHIVSHGINGALQLGDTRLGSDNVSDFAGQLQSWRNSLSADADVLIYGCDLAGSSDGQSLADTIAGLTGADVAASSDLTGAADQGGDWDLEYQAGNIETVIAFDAATQAAFTGVLMGAPVPEATVNLPAEEMINEGFQFSIDFDNTSMTASDVGYAPYVDLSVPDGIDMSGASYFGSPITMTLAGEFDGTGTLVDIVSGLPINHPLTGLPVTGGTTGDSLYVIELPFGSFVPDQPVAQVTVDATLNSATGASVGVGMSVEATGGFALGSNPLNDPGSDPPIIGVTSSDSITPTVLNLTKGFDAAETESATGPNYPITYTLVVDVANGETITNLDITDFLPNSFVYNGGVTITTDAGVVVTGQSITDEPATGAPQNSPNNDFLIEFASVAGTASDSDVVISYQVYVAEFDATTVNPVIAPLNGDTVLATNDSAAAGTHTSGPVSDNDAATDLTLQQKSIALQKGVSIYSDVGATGATPGDTLEYTLEFQVSDFFEFSSLVLDDDFSDGQRFDTGYTPTYDVTENGVTSSGTFAAPNYSVTLDSPGTGRTALWFDVSAHAGTLTGDLFADASQDGPTTVTVTYHTVIQDAFSDTFPSGDASVDIGDELDNDVDVTGTLPGGQTESDDSSAGIAIEGPTISKSVYAINGSTLNSGDPIGAGISTTYRLQLTLPTADAEYLVLADYMPLPIFDATTLVTFDKTLGPTAVPPPAGVAVYGPTHNLHTIVPSTHTGLTQATMLTDSDANSVSFDFGTFDTVANTPAVIDILFTVVGQDVRMADGLTLTNQVQASFGSTNAGTIDSGDLAFMVVSAPELTISKGIVSTTAVSPTFNPATVAPVVFTNPGLAGPSFGGGINSTNLAATPIDSNLTDADAGDLVKFAIVIENSGSADGFDLTAQDVPPPTGQYIIPTSGLNLEVRDGDGNLLTWTGDLFAGGIEIDDPSAVTGAINDALDAGAASDGSNIIVVTYDMELATAVTPSTTYTNNAELTEYGAVDGGLDHTAGQTNADWADDATIDTLATNPSKSIVTTSEIHTGVVGGVERVTIGEIIRYQLAVEIPEGTLTDFNLRDNLPGGLQFIDDNTATVAFISNGGGISSTDGSATLAVGLGTSPAIAGNAIVSPPLAAPHLLGDVHVGSTGSLTTNTDSYSNGTDPYFKLGTVVNADNDADSEFIVVEFNALVLNNPGSNNNNDLRRNDFDVRLGSTTDGTSNDVDVRITEPSITNLTKTASPTTGDAGDVITFTVSYRNSNAANRTNAFNARVLDTLPSEYVLDLTSVAVTLADGAVGINNNSIGNTVDVTIDNVPRNGYVEITYEATLQVAVEPSEIVTNTADLTYTSLPFAGGTIGNATGSDTPGASGDDNGERDGSGTGLNDYSDTANGNVTIDSPSIVKSLVGTSIDNTTNAANQAVIGETIQYSVLVTLPEGTANVAEIVDTLDVGILFVSLDSIVTSAGVTSSTVDLNDSSTITPSIAGQDVIFDLGDITNSNSTNATPETITLTYTVRVDNVVGNQGDGAPGTLLNNSAEFGWEENGTPTATASSSAANVEVIEPNLDISKSVSPALVDAGDTVTYTINISHNAASDTDAFDVTFSDTISSSFSVNFPTDVTITHSTLGDIRGNFELTAGNELRTTAVGAFDLLHGETVSIVVNATVLGTAIPNDTINNTAGIDWTSLSGADPFERGGGGGGVNDYNETASASNMIQAPTISKTIADTGINNTTNDNTEAVIGETIQYQVTVTVPESTLDLAAITDMLNLGLEFVSLDNIEAFSGGLPTPSVTSTVDAFSNTASFNPTVTGDGSTVAQQLDFDLGTLVNSDTNNLSGETLVLTYTVRVVNITGNQSDAGPGNLLNNSAVLGWDSGGTPDFTSAATAPQVEVIEPHLAINKSVLPTNADAGDSVTYTIDISHAVDSDTDAFDVTFEDTIPSEVNVTFLSDVTVTHSTAGPITGLFELTAGNVLRTIAGNSFDLLAGETVTITVNGLLDISTQPGDSLQNNAGILWSSIDNAGIGERDGSDGEGGPLNDYAASSSADITVPSPTIAKNLVGTSIDTVDNASNEVVIGELVQYQIEVFLPEGTSNTAQLFDTLDVGLEFVSLDSIQAQVAGLPSGDITSSIDLFSNTSSFAPTIVGDGSTIAQSLTFDLGTLVNSNTINASADAVVLTYSARVMNISGNTSNGAATGTQLDNLAFFQFDLKGTPTSTPTDTVQVEVIEPELAISKTISDDTLHLGQVAMYTLTVNHTANSDAEARDIAVTDLIPANMTLNVTSINVTGATIVTNSSVGNTIDLVLDELAVGNTITITYDATVTSDQAQIGASLNNTASLSWTSLPDGITAGSGNERDGDAGSGGEDDYAASSSESAQIIHPLVELTKTLVGSPVPASSGTPGNFDVTYDLTFTSTGNDPLTQVSLLEDLAAQYGGAFAGLVPQAGQPASIVSSTAVDSVELNLAYDGGISDAELIDNSGANTNKLDNGESVTIRIVIEIDPDAATAILSGGALVNQAEVDGTGEDTGFVAEDDSDDPSNAADFDNNGDGNPDDPNTLRFPVISLQKQKMGVPAPAASGTPGNFDVTYQFTISNDGSTDLEIITLTEDLFTQFGGAFVGIIPQSGAPAVITASTATDDPGINAAYDGNLAGTGSAQIFDTSTSLLEVNQSITVQIIVEVDPDSPTTVFDAVSGDGNRDFENQASTSGEDPADLTNTPVTDNSDDPTVGANVDDDGDNDPDDPTSLVLPNITLTKTQAGPAVAASSGTAGNFDVTFDLSIVNTGNDALSTLSLLEDLSTQYGGAFVGLLGPATITSSTATDVPELNALYDGGTGDAELFDNSGANTNLLDIGQQVTVRIVIEVDPDSPTANIVSGSLFNQADASGIGANSGATVTDQSDDPADGAQDDPNSDNNPDDANENRFPLLSLTKSVVGSPVPASSTTQDNYDVTYQFTISNDGTTPLDSLTLIEDLQTQFGGAFVRIVPQTGSPAVITATTATDDPGINTAFDGTTANANIFDGSTSLLDVNQTITVQIVVEVDPDAATANYDTISGDGNGDLENQASTAGTDPVSGQIVDDNSDDPSDATNTDDDADNDPDDPTALLFPNITLEKALVGSPVAAASGLAGNFDVIYDLTVINNGNEALQSLSLVEDLQAHYGGAFVRIVPQTGLPATIQSSTASDDPEINASYDGTTANSQLFDNSGANSNLLDVGASFTVRIVIEIDPDSPTANIVAGGLFNQATVSGTGNQSAVTVGDESDDPTNGTDGDLNGDNDPDDANEIRIPHVSLQKQVVGSPVPASSATQDNYDVTYQFTISNDGTTQLDSLTLIEDLQTQFGGAFVRIVPQTGSPAVITTTTATDDPGINTAYDGTTANANIFDGSTSLLDVNQTITVQIVVEVDPDAATANYDTISGDGNGDLENQASTAGTDSVSGQTVDDNSDDPSDAANSDDDADNDPDDPTALLFPNITLEKALVGSPVAAASGLAGNFDVIYDLTVINNGNEALQSLSLVEDLQAHYGGAFVRIVPQTGLPATIQSSTASDDPEINASYDGTTANSQLFDNSGANSNLLDVGASFTVRIVIEIDPDSPTANIVAGGLFNQATVSGTGNQSAVTVGDESDDPTNGTDGDLNGDNDPDDANEIRIPHVSLQKQVVGSPVPASSATQDNYDVTYQFTISNDGTTPLDSLTLIEDLQTQFGGAFVRIVPQTGSPAVITTTTATDDPGINTAYDGTTANANIFDGSTSLLDVNQTITVQIVVEVDPDAATANYDTISGDGNGDLENQASTAGTDPVSGQIVDDNSDDPSDATNTDDDADNDPDDPTALLFPNITLEKALVGSPVPASSGTFNNFDVTYDLTFTNHGNEGLNSLSLLEDLAAQYGGAFVGIVPQAGSPATIQTSTASDAVEINALYDGGNTDAQLIDNSGGNTNLLSPGEAVTVRIVIEIDPDAPGAIYNAGDLVNQATIAGTGVQSASVAQDDSDDPGNGINDDPNSDNDPDDANTLRFPLISLSKSIVGSPLPGASGTQGNFDVTYQFVISNDGSIALDNLTLIEDLQTQFGGAFVRIVPQAGSPAVITASTATDDPGINTAYDGTTANSNLFDASSSLLDVNETITVQIVVEVDPDNTGAIYDSVTGDGNIDLENQATTSGNDAVNGQLVDDDSDDPGDVTNSDNDSDGEPDDHTALVLPDITLTKTLIGAPVPASSATQGNFDLTYDLEVTNTGNDPLSSLSLLEDLSLQYGGAFVQIVPQAGSPASIQSSTATDAIEVNTAYDGGATDAQLIDNSTNTNLLNPGESVVLRIVIEVDPDSPTATLASGSLMNQATTQGTGQNSGLMPTDNSDDPTDPTDSGAAVDNNPDDPNAVRIPDVTLTKDLVGVPVAASSGTFANYDVTYRFVVSNSGTTPLDSLSVVDDWGAQFGGAFIRIVPATISVNNLSALTPPGANAAYAGGATENMLDGTGVINSGESFEILLTVEVDPNAPGAVYVNGGLENQATVTGEDPAQPGVFASDLSDDPTNTTEADPDSDNNPDDPTNFVIPELGAAKRIVRSVPSSTTPAAFDATYEIRFRNLGTTELTNLSLVDDLQTRMGPAYLGLVGMPTIVSSTASIAPSLNSSFDGGLAGSTNLDILDGSSGLLLPGEEVVIQYVSLLKADDLTAASHNQAIVSGDHASGTISDLSDTGSDPESTNAGTTGDTGGEDDPTLPPGLGIAKEHGFPVPAGPSGEDWQIPITMVVENVGLTDLVGLQLFEDISAQFGAAVLSVSTPIIDGSGISVGTAPSVNAAWTGDTSLNMLDGTGLLAPNDTFTITFDVLLNPDASGTSSMFQNQANVSATDPANPLVDVLDLSDSGTDAGGINSGEPGDTGTSDDPTPLLLPDIGVAKQIVGIQQNGATYDLTIQFVVENTGSVDLIDLSLNDDLSAQFAPHFGSVVSAPQIVASTATTDPIINAGFVIDTTQDIFDGASGLLKPGENVTIEVVVNIDPDFTQLTNGRVELENQAVAGGTALDDTGNPLTDPSGNPLPAITDDSDSGADPNENNPGADGDSGGFDDPTPISLNVFAFDSRNNFLEDGFGHQGREYIDRVLPAFPIDTIYSGITEPGTTLRFKIYSEDGHQVGERTVVADAAGNWLASFPGTIIFKQPHHMDVEQTATANNRQDDAGFNLRRYFHPAVHHSLYFSEKVTVQSVMRGQADVVINTMHEANNRPLSFGWSAHSYEMVTSSTNASHK